MSSVLSALCAAALRGDRERVLETLDAHPEVLNERGTLPGHTGARTALHFAVAGLHEEVVRLLLFRGASPNIRDESDNAFPLHFAAEREHMGIIHLLVEHGADVVGTGDYHELEVIGWATVFGSGDPAVVEYLLGHGARHTIPSAVSLGDPTPIRALVARWPDELHKRMDGTNRRRTPLHLAVVKKQPTALITLLQLGADPNALDAAGLTPLDQAALDGERELARALIDAGARVELPAAVALNRKADVERILRDDGTCLWPGKRYGSLIVQASERASGTTIEGLLRCGASVTVTASTDTAADGAIGYTALHAAAFHGNVGAAQVLLSAGANVRAREERYGATPAGWAQYAGHRAVCRMILEGDIDIFDAVEFDLVARIPDIVSRDPGALTRRFGEYVTRVNGSGALRTGDDVRTPERTPLDVAVAMGHTAAARVLRDLAANEGDVAHAERVARFLRNACRDWRSGGGGDIQMARGTASRLLQQYPGIARENIFTAVTCGDIDTVHRVLAARPGAAGEFGGPHNWPPLLYLASARIEQPESAANGVAITRLLLEDGASPNVHYPGGNPDIHYTVLMCVLGMGEEQAPPHPHARELTALLLDHGAEPYDQQVLYNVFADHASRPHLTNDIVWLLELMYAHSVRLGRAADWNDPEWTMLDMGGYRPGAHYLLGAAVEANLLGLAEWLLVHGASPNACAANLQRSQRSLHENALRLGHLTMAERLVRYGAMPSEYSREGYEAFVAACLDLNRTSASDMILANPEYLRDPRALITATRHDNADAVSLLLDLGVSPDLEDANDGRSRALHTAAYWGATHAAEVLLARGADVDARETTYGATPMGVALWAQQPRMTELLGKYSHDLFNLVFAGNVKRVREVLQHQPGLATSVQSGGESLLMCLPDDEDRALEVAKLLLSHGADPALRDSRGVSAAGIAHLRALDRVYALLKPLE